MGWREGEERLGEGRRAGLDGFVAVFSHACEERRWTAKSELPSELEEPCLEWIRKESAKGKGLEEPSWAWFGTVCNDHGEIVELDILATPLAFAAASGLRRSAELLLSLGADPLWSFDLSHLGIAKPADLILLAGGELDCSWRGAFCLGLVQSAIERASLSESVARAGRPPRALGRRI